LSVVLRHKSIPSGIYFGLLSPFIGAMMMFHPAAILVVLVNLAVCIPVGMITGFLIALTSRAFPNE
jgi:ABC-type transport system involved in cytochrome c biogenesis permease component